MIFFWKDIPIAIKKKIKFYTFPGRLKPKAIKPLEICLVFAFNSIVWNPETKTENDRNSEWYIHSHGSISYKTFQFLLPHGAHSVDLVEIMERLGLEMESFGDRLSLSICLFWSHFNTRLCLRRTISGRCPKKCGRRLKALGEGVTNGDNATEIRYLPFTGRIGQKRMPAKLVINSTMKLFR